MGAILTHLSLRSSWRLYFLFNITLARKESRNLLSFIYLEVIGLVSIRPSPCYVKYGGGKNYTT